MGYSYKDWVKVLSKAGFRVTEGRRHIMGIKAIPETGEVLRVPVKRQGSKQVPKGLHSEMLKEAGLTPEEFEKYLRD